MQFKSVPSVAIWLLGRAKMEELDDIKSSNGEGGGHCGRSLVLSRCNLNSHDLRSLRTASPTTIISTLKVRTALDLHDSYLSHSSSPSLDMSENTSTEPFPPLRPITSRSQSYQKANGMTRPRRKSSGLGGELPGDTGVAVATIAENPQSPAASIDNLASSVSNARLEFHV